jgi:SET domain-containing protein
MLCIKTEVKESNIPNAGKGLFSLQFVPKGSIVYIQTTDFPNYKIVLPAQYEEDLKIANEFPINAGMRWGGDYFIYSSQHPINIDYINHDNNPNVLSCLGFFFARRDIHCGDELTIDYKYLGMDGQEAVITNEQEKIIGVSAKECLLKTAQDLIDLLNEVEEIHCFDLHNRNLEDV